MENNFITVIKSLDSLIHAERECAIAFERKENGREILLTKRQTEYSKLLKEILKFKWGEYQ